MKTYDELTESDILTLINSYNIHHEPGSNDDIKHLSLYIMFNVLETEDFLMIKLFYNDFGTKLINDFNLINAKRVNGGNYTVTHVLGNKTNNTN